MGTADARRLEPRRHERLPPLAEALGAREPGDEGARLVLVAAEVVAAAAQRCLLRRRDAGHEEDEIEDEAEGEEAEPAPRRRDGDEPVGEPGQRLEEVVGMS